MAIKLTKDDLQLLRHGVGLLKDGAMRALGDVDVINKLESLEKSLLSFQEQTKYATGYILDTDSTRLGTQLYHSSHLERWLD